jgi:hypothetical protein
VASLPRFGAGCASLLAQWRKDPHSTISNTRVIKPSTRLIREWQGKSHKVTVANSGFEYDGQWYASLSEIARLITGTRWSGPYSLA